MGDGTLKRQSKNSSIQIETVTQEYLEYLDDTFGVISTGVKFCSSAEQNEIRLREGTGYKGPADCSDTYIWWTRTHPDFNQYRSWYDSGKKIWPTDIELTPTTLKHWYVGDGSWTRGGSNNYITISMSNERQNTDKVKRYFAEAGLPVPNFRSSGHRFDAYFTVNESEQLWKYMGEPLPGFEYKWPNRFK